MGSAWAEIAVWAAFVKRLALLPAPASRSPIRKPNANMAGLNESTGAASRGGKPEIDLALPIFCTLTIFTPAEFGGMKIAGRIDSLALIAMRGQGRKV